MSRDLRFWKYDAMDRKGFEKLLPSQYNEVAHIRFDNMKTGFWYDLKAVFPGIILTVIGWVIVKPTLVQALISLVIFAAAIYPYFSLHEIIHGLVIKVMTKQRVEIGFIKSGAYCSMPELYMYKKVAVRCTAAPLIVFSLLFGVGTIILIVVNHWAFFPLGLMATLHLLGCRSDINLLNELSKYKSESLLVKDAGIEQLFYLPSMEE